LDQIPRGLEVPIEGEENTTRIYKKVFRMLLLKINPHQKQKSTENQILIVTNQNL
jgi:hypothetical protein